MSRRFAVALGAVVIVAAAAIVWLLRPGSPGGAPDEVSPARTRPPERTPATRPGDAARTGDATRPDGAPSGTTAPATATPVVVEPRITGRVVEGDDRPVPGAEVALRAAASGRDRVASAPDGPELGRTTTDGDGRFLLATPPRGAFRVTASAAGRATAAVLALAPGADVVLRLGPAGTVVARVLDEEAKPVAGAAVEVRAGEVVRAAVADADGRAVVDAVAAGTATVAASAPGRTRAEAGPVTVEAGGTTTVLLTTSPAVTLAGRVLDAAGGAPVAGAEVHVAHPGRSAAAGRTGADGAFGPVEAGTPGERVFVAVRADGFAPTADEVVLAAAGTPQEIEVRLVAAAPWRGRVVDAAGAGVEGARVTYTADGVAGREGPTATSRADGSFDIAPAPPPLPGRQVFLTAELGARRGAVALFPDEAPPSPLVVELTEGASVSGRVVRPDGAPAAGVVVRLAPARLDAPRRRRDANGARLGAAGARGLDELTTATAPDGRWALGGVPEGSYHLYVEAAGSGRWSPSPVQVAGGAADAGTFVLGAGLRIEGRTLSTRGGPLAGVRVTVAATNPDEGRRAVSTVSGPDGRFLFEDLAEGAVTVVASRAGLEPAETSLDLRLPQSIELVLLPAGWIDLAVTADGAPWSGVAAATLEARGVRASTRTVNVAAGRARLEDVSRGSWSVTLEAAGGRVARAPATVDVEPGRSSGAAVDLAAGASVEGTVRTEEGQAVRGAVLYLRRDGVTRRSATADAAGRFRLDGLPAGRYELRAVGEGGVPETRDLSLVAGDRATLDLTLAGGGHLVVIVQDENGRPRADASVMPQGVGGAGVPGATPPRTGPDGRVTLRHLPPGPVQVFARHPADGTTGRTRADVAKGETVTVTLVLSAPRSPR